MRITRDPFCFDSNKCTAVCLLFSRVISQSWKLHKKCGKKQTGCSNPRFFGSQDSGGQCPPWGETSCEDGFEGYGCDARESGCRSAHSRVSVSLRRARGDESTIMSLASSRFKRVLRLLGRGSEEKHLASAVPPKSQQNGSLNHVRGLQRVANQSVILLRCLSTVR